MTKPNFKSFPKCLFLSHSCIQMTKVKRLPKYIEEFQRVYFVFKFKVIFLLLRVILNVKSKNSTQLWAMGCALGHEFAPQWGQLDTFEWVIGLWYLTDIWKYLKNWMRLSWLLLIHLSKTSLTRSASVVLSQLAIARLWWLSRTCNNFFKSGNADCEIVGREVFASRTHYIKGNYHCMASLMVYFVCIQLLC